MGPFARIGLSLSIPASASLVRQPFQQPVRSFRSTTLARFAPDRAASPRQTRCRFHDRLRPPLRLPSLPFGTLTSLRIKAPANFATVRPTFRLRPISSRSPPACTVLSIAFRNSGRFASPLHGSRFLQLPLQRLKTRRDLFLNGTVRSHRPFTYDPGLSFALSPAASTARSVFPLRYPYPVRPGQGRFIASDPLPLPRPASPAAPLAFAPL